MEVVMNVIADLIGKKVHFIGIGGVSMSGIAKCFAENGVIVQGSDSALADSKYIEDFTSLGIKLFQSHEENNIAPDTFLIVKTSTVIESNPEIIQARKLGVRIIERFEALEIIIAQFKVKIGISGSSGKTTTTALCWEAMKFASQTMPSCVIGTILNEVNSSVFVNNDSEICVAEADESDGSFADMNFDVVIITDIDADHLDHKRYEGKRENLIQHFKRFAEKTLKNGGIVIYNGNCKTTTTLMEQLYDYAGSMFIYSGIDKVANLENINLEDGDCYLKEAKNLPNAIEFSCGGRVSLENIRIPMIGKLNAFNALPGLILAWELFGVESPDIFLNFKGANKRCEIVGTVGNITVIDDYAHSPKKIKAFIDSFASYCRDIDAKFVIICEPHKYTRVASLYNEYITCFDSCDNLIMMEIFGIQGRDSTNEVSSEKLVSDIEKLWKDKKSNFLIKNLKFNKMLLEKKTFEFMEEFLERKQQMFYVLLGAGYSNKYAHLLYDKLKNNDAFKA